MKIIKEYYLEFLNLTIISGSRKYHTNLTEGH